MKSSWSERFLKLKPYQRVGKTKKDIKEKKRNYPDSINQRKDVKHYTAEELIEWGNENGIMVVRDLWRMASIKEDTPTFRNVLEEFGSWQKYKDQLKNTKRGLVPEMTDEEYVKFCLRVGCTGKVIDYMKRCSKYKGIMLPYPKVVKKFGSWYNFRKLICCFDVDNLLETYVEKSIEYGHPLKLKECDEIGLEIRRAMKLYGKRVFNLLIREKEKQIYLRVIGEEMK